MRRRVLVVDDDRAILEVLDMRLGAMGFDVTVTADPRAAIDAVDGTHFDLALCDLRMDPMDGITLMEALHEHQPRLPVLIMTAHGTIETAVEAVQRGAFDYLTKPFVRDELRAKIVRALSARRWARDRERLLAVGEVLASSGIMARVLEAVAQAAVETTEAERCVVFQLEQGRLVSRASAGQMPAPLAPFEQAASLAIGKGTPTTCEGTEGRMFVAAPLLVQQGPAGALVIETPPRVETDEEDLDLLALFSAQAAVAIRNTLDLERMRSGALAALGRMSTQVAHELKNPLAGLRLYARHLEQRFERNGDGDGSELAKKINSTVDHLAAVVSEITAFGRPPELHRAPVALGLLVDECLALALARRPDEEVEVTREYDAACPEALLDARELRKAFSNLILNAVEALTPGGRVTISTKYAAEERAITVVIEDTGTGMNEETLSRMFDLFYTTKSDGTGLGMAIARSVIDLHGGRLTIESRVGHGTRAVVRLPVDMPPVTAKSDG